MASNKTPESPGAAKSGADEWHERHQRGELGGYGTYGGAQDQPPEVGDAQALAAQQPAVPRSERRPDAGRAPDAEPYRAERVDGGAADDRGNVPVGKAPEGKVTEMSEQFAGQDSATAVTPEARAHGKALQANAPDDARAQHLMTLIAQAGLQARDVRVSCQQDKVVVRGHVAEAGTKAAITEVIRSAAGQASIDNGIEVRPVPDAPVSGQGLAADVDEYTVLNGRQV